MNWESELDHLIYNQSVKFTVRDLPTLFFHLNNQMPPYKCIGDNAFWGDKLLIIQVWDNNKNDNHVIVKLHSEYRNREFSLAQIRETNDQPYLYIYEKINSILKGYEDEKSYSPRHSGNP